MVSSAGSPRARTLAAMLRAAREEAKVSQRELARQLGVTHPTIGRWESGETPINAEDASAYLVCVGVVGEEREKILRIARGDDEEDWLASGPPGTAPQLAGVMDCERTARRITEWAPLGIPGLLQTSEYARTIIRLGAGGLPSHELQSRVMVRLGRRDALIRREPMQFLALIGEPAVRARVGGSDIMTDQLRYVRDIAKRDNVSLHVVSVTGEWHPGIAGPFILYEFDDGMPAIVYLEHHRSGAFLVEQDPAQTQDVVDYKAAVESIRRAAMSAEESVALIADVISTLERTI